HAVGGEYPRSHSWVEVRLARRHNPDRSHDLLAWRVLEQEASGSGSQCAGEHLIVVECGQDEDWRAAGQATQPTGGLGAIDVLHSNVHYHDVGPQLIGGRDHLSPISAIADHLEALLRAEDHPQTRPHQRLVVDEKHARGRGARHVSWASSARSLAAWLSASGREQSTAQPAPSGPATTLPPSSSARSRMPMSPKPEPPSERIIGAPGRPAVLCTRSRTRRSMSSSIFTSAPGACLATFASASWAMR